MVIDPLSATVFENATFDKLDLVGADLSRKEFIRCIFRNTKMSDTVWQQCRLEDCVFENCDLANMRPKRMACRGVEFAHCKLIGVEWGEIAPAPMVTFSDCSMRYQSFVSLKLPDTLFLRCSIVDSTFIEVDLTKATFSDCELTKTQFERCTLVNADFSSSRGLYFDTTKNRIKHAHISLETAAGLATALGLRVSGYGTSNHE